MDIPTSLLISYTVFSFFLFYQQLHLKNFQGASAKLAVLLGLFAFSGTLFGISFLFYWGYRVSWLQACLLFAIALFIQGVWFSIEARLRLRAFYWVFSLAGFIVLPISGYFMWEAIP